MFENAEVIHTYTRAQAIADGVLIDTAGVANEFKLPIALTAEAWAEAVAWDYGSGQSEEARLRDVLMLAYLAALGALKTSEVLFTVAVVPNQEGAELPKDVTLKLVIGGGDNHEPVLTIMQPNQD